MVPGVRTCALTIWLDDRTRAVRPVGGYHEPGGWSGPGAEPAVSVRYLAWQLDRLVGNSDCPFRRGERIELTGATIEVAALTDDDRPAEVTFRFHAPLEDTSFLWFAVTWDGFAPLVLPGVGRSATIVSPLDAKNALWP